MEDIPILRQYDVAKEDWLVGRSTGNFPPHVF